MIVFTVSLANKVLSLPECVDILLFFGAVLANRINSMVAGPIRVIPEYTFCRCQTALLYGFVGGEFLLRFVVPRGGWVGQEKWRNLSSNEWPAVQGLIRNWGVSLGRRRGSEGSIVEAGWCGSWARYIVYCSTLCDPVLMPG